MKPWLKRVILPIYQFIMVHLFPKKLNLKGGSEESRAYLFLSPDYGNVGDIAIYFAQVELLQKFYKAENIISISVQDTYKYAKSIKRNITLNDAIYLVGGGNFGGLYPAADYGRLFILKYFKKYKIVSFPQTITEASNYSFISKYIKAFSSCVNCYLFLREKKSYELACQYFSKTEIKIYLVPDIVFSLKKTIPMNSERDSAIILSLRKDKEGLLSEKDKTYIKEKLKLLHFSFQEIDTIVDNYNSSDKEKYFQYILKNYSQAKMVITDRLHGMIFAYITRTPCIVFDNNNGKIKNTYSLWLKDCKYICFAEDFGELNKYITYFEQLTTDDFECTIDEKYEKLVQAIKLK